jgi:hypothetical protein
MAFRLKAEATGTHERHTQEASADINRRKHG